VDLSFLPAVNASLNGLATLLLVVGLVLIKLQKREAHKKAMLAAFTCSGVFLVCYVTHYIWRASVVGGSHTPYTGPMGKRFYFALLGTHILLAITVPVFAIALIRLGLKERYETHKKVARIAWPIWFYVSVTGVVIYFMLYHFNGPMPETRQGTGIRGVHQAFPITSPTTAPTTLPATAPSTLPAE
jgi:uncharacterized membrane protein YozB (DUF420 family)